MHERRKIEEAKYILQQLEYEAIAANAVGVKHSLNLFLASARSVLQYAYREARRTKLGLQWYNSTMASSRLLQFMKEKRDDTIHEKPIGPSQLRSMSVTHVSPETYLPTTPAPGSTRTKYIFPDWDEPGDVVALCQRYLEEIDLIVVDGMARGYITG